MSHTALDPRPEAVKQTPRPFVAERLRGLRRLVDGQAGRFGDSPQLA